MKDGGYKVVSFDSESGKKSWEVNTENIDSPEMLVEYLEKVGAAFNQNDKGIFIHAQTMSDARGWVVLADETAIAAYNSQMSDESNFL